MRAKRKAVSAEAFAVIGAKPAARADVGVLPDPPEANSPAAVCLAPRDELTLPHGSGKCYEMAAGSLPRWNGETYDLAVSKEA